jgi:plastocyanin
MRRVLLSLLLLFPAGLACSSKPPSCDSPTATTTVDISQSTFSPSCVSTGADATLTIVNNDDIPHTFTVKGTDIDVKLDGGATDQASLAGLAPGTYQVTCSYHPEMRETLQIG